jgi:hypothetical protein
VVTNVSSAWVDGDLVYYDKDKNIIFTIDGTNRKVTYPSGAVLDVDAARTILALGDVFKVFTATGQDETGDVTIPVTGVASGDRVLGCLVFTTAASIATVAARAASDFSVTGTNEVTVGANAANNTGNQYVFFVLDLT